MSDRNPSRTPTSDKGAHLRLVAGPNAARHAPDGPAREVTANEAANAADFDLADAYRRYAPYVAAVALRVTGHDGELDDLVQDVFLDATRGIRGLRDPEAIKAWLARITVRACIRRLRYRRLRRALALDREAVDYERLASDDASPEARAMLAKVYRALERLPAEARTAWVMRHVQGETLEAAAAAMGCSLSTYQRRLRLATRRLEKELPHE